jgi:hypothetical protein
MVTTMPFNVSFVVVHAVVGVVVEALLPMDRYCINYITTTVAVAAGITIWWAAQLQGIGNSIGS